jgi:hypothetical protein
LSAGVVIDHAVRFCVVLVAEGEIVVQRLAVYGQLLPACLGDGLDALRARHVHNIEGRVAALGEQKHAADRGLLANIGPGFADILSLLPSFPVELVHAMLDEAVVLAMHHGDAAMLGRLLHDAPDPPSSVNIEPEAEAPEKVVNILKDETPPDISAGISSSTSRVALPVIIAWRA